MSGFRSRLVQPQALSAEERALWGAWSDALPAPANAFLSLPYVTAVNRALGGVRVCVIDEQQRPVAFFPFQYRSRWHRVLGLADRLGGELSDYFGLIAEPGFTISSDRLLDLAGIRSLLFTHLDESQATFGLTGESPETGLRIELPEGGAEFWQALRASDKKFVSDTERRERKLIEAAGPLKLTFHHDDPAELTFLIDRKRQQYARTGADDALGRPEVKSLLAELQQSHAPECRGVLSTLYAGDQWVASHFGLMSHGTLHFWFPVYNPDMRTYSPGRMLVLSVIRQASELGVLCIDRGAGDTPAKRDFANASHSYSRGLWQRPGVTALAVRASLAVQWRWKRICEQRRGTVT